MQLLIQLVREILYLSGKSPLRSSRGISETSGCDNHVLPIQCILNRDGIRSIERALTKFTVLLFLLTAVIKKMGMGFKPFGLQERLLNLK